jgi:hypothetical protein
VEKIKGIKENERTKYKNGRKGKINRKRNNKQEMKGIYKERKKNKKNKLKKKERKK